jgi:thioredoxin reductase
VFHCPYCDAYEFQGRALAAYGRGAGGAALAEKLRAWSDDVALLADGGDELDAEERHALAASGIEVRTERIAALEGGGGALARVRFASGEALARDALFFATAQYARSVLGEQLGCAFTRKGVLWTGERQRASVRGVYVAGDLSRDAQLVSVAAAEGATAAIALHEDLAAEERAARSASARATVR